MDMDVMRNGHWMWPGVDLGIRDAPEAGSGAGKDKEVILTPENSKTVKAKTKNKKQKTAPQVLVNAPQGSVTFIHHMSVVGELVFIVGELVAGLF